MYTEVLFGANALGCDSTVNLDLTITNAATGVDVRTACDSLTWIDGNLYTTSNNTATYTYVNSTGCDSVVSLDLTIYNNTSGVDVQTACDSYTWIDGITYTSDNNTATFNLTNAGGCDSLVSLNLSILNSSSATDTQTACDSLTWIDGNTYTASNNTATFTLTNAVGCDSVVTLDLTILNSSTSTDSQTACESYTWIDGNTYTANNNTATFTLTNAAGCDSLVKLDLTIESLDVNVTQLDADLSADQAGASYQWVTCPSYTAISGETNQSFTATAVGDYAVIISSTACLDTSACFTVSQVGIIENDFGAALKLYPNPTFGQFSIALGESYDEATVIIRDLSGRTVQTKAFTNSQLLNLSLNEAAGIYILHLEADGKEAIIRLMKK